MAQSLSSYPESCNVACIFFFILCVIDDILVNIFKKSLNVIFPKNTCWHISHLKTGCSHSLLQNGPLPCTPSTELPGWGDEVSSVLAGLTRFNSPGRQRARVMRVCPTPFTHKLVGVSIRCQPAVFTSLLKFLIKKINTDVATLKNIYSKECPSKLNGFHDAIWMTGHEYFQVKCVLNTSQLLLIFVFFI